jgi:hypothetical protein
MRGPAEAEASSSSSSEEEEGRLARLKAGNQSHRQAAAGSKPSLTAGQPHRSLREGTRQEKQQQEQGQQRHVARRAELLSLPTHLMSKHQRKRQRQQERKRQQAAAAAADKAAQ